MSPDLITWLWLVSGLGLIIAEYFLPHFFSGFLGAAAILVAVLRWTGLFTDFVPSFAAWAVLSVVLIVSLRQFAIKKLHAESSVQPTDEDVAAHGEVVEVVARISSEDNKGRIRYLGTSWPAVSREGVIEAGQKARLLYRDNLNWIVEPHPELTERSSHPITEKEKN
jgi:membrane protein implicated in regulation of membrane protease activity